ncbi:hypothetical protein M153_7790002382 [Pseudoloma neurophilia]|uniref:Nucleoporin Nup54 alpha-helical domain-containing protein n=1 Tax=Pseudoloma neurophilia TaxID=146866 RepID=A0A0R0LW02_9MICR|nr:hypothetical protein M153_7790002382 [Pseudoloma neurophilia]
MSDPLERLTELERAYDINSPYYKFTYQFYNLASGPLQTTQTYPVTIRGYDDLKKRTDQQKQISLKIEGSLDALSDKLEKISSKSNILQQKMYNILLKLRNSHLRTKMILQNRSTINNFELEQISEIKTYQSPNELPKIMNKIRLVLQNLLNAVKNLK